MQVPYTRYVLCESERDKKWKKRRCKSVIPYVRLYLRMQQNGSLHIAIGLNWMFEPRILRIII